MINWEQNPNSSYLPLTRVGDVIRLRFVDVFQYLVKAEVKSTEGGNIIAVIESVFDAPTGFEIRGGEVLSIIGQTHVIPPVAVQDVIRNPKVNARSNN